MGNTLPVFFSQPTRVPQENAPPGADGRPILRHAGGNVMHVQVQFPIIVVQQQIG